MVTFLKAVVKPAELSPTVSVVSVGSRNLDHFVKPQMNRKNSYYRAVTSNFGLTRNHRQSPHHAVGTVRLRPNRLSVDLKYQARLPSAATATSRHLQRVLRNGV